jgi:catechol 2,3-dioxygenase-like lactoylglutathione lyase family enzyme
LTITKIDFVAVPSTDVERSRAFYIDTLGLRQDERNQDEFWVGETCFGIYEPATYGIEFVPQTTAPLGLHVDDMEAARGELEAKGVVFGGETLANRFYGELLGLEKNPNSPGDDWVEYEAGNVTLAVMTPHTHEYEFTPLPPATLALRVPDVAAAKAKLEAAGLEVGEMWDSGVCNGAGVSDPAGNRVLLHRRYAPYPDGSKP